MVKNDKQMRKCRLCGEVKPIELFEIDRRVKGGRTTRCKACKAGLNDRARTLYAGLKHRAKQAGQPVEVTLKEIQALFAAFDGKCIYCEKTEEETGESHHVDHVIPVSEGGRHHISNLVLSCASCNRQKGDRPFIELYLRKQKEINAENFNALIYYISLTSGQPVDEILIKFINDYVVNQYGHISEILGDEMQEVVETVVKQNILEGNAS